ncbi:TetR/AcrR family transcriptional regulator [Pseudorhodoferax sp. LjRoot39]|uniref:TetR/AcrR family transcriptional regulator n=1 Tax=Pseudorhodoferax sp. LjRoot39 TaxID=3342328 RepID=UPI003ECCC7EB
MKDSSMAKEKEGSATTAPGRSSNTKAAVKRVPAPASKRAAVPAAKRAPAAKAKERAALPDKPEPKRKRRNRRSDETIANILAATEQIVLDSGASRISILDVCKMVGISRGTFYRYYSSQDELLDAFSRHKRDEFHHKLIEATAPHDDPDERFKALVDHLDNYLEHGRARRLLVVAPDYALTFFKRIFNDAIVRFEDVLDPVFDAWDDRLGIKIDRDLVCEMLIRYVMSALLVPSTSDRVNLPKRVGRLVQALTNQGRGQRR